MGNTCKLCGMIFPEGAEIIDPLESNSKTNSKVAVDDEEDKGKGKIFFKLFCFIKKTFLS